MSDETRETFQFLTLSYQAEPTPENAQRLWGAAFALPGWHLLLRESDGEMLPLLGTAHDQLYLWVWTDEGTLRDFVETSGLREEGPESRAILLPLPEAVGQILRFEEHGIEGVRFNPPGGWSVPFARLRAVAERFGIGGEA